jgi:lysozyme
MADFEAAKALLIKHEGLRLKPYVDTVGKLTIGVGRNLTDVGITLAEANFLLENDLNKVITVLTARLPWLYTLNSARQIVLLNMAFNMGVEGLLQFHTTLALIQAGHYDQAASAMLQSKWATQVGQRAIELARIMQTGEI